MKALFVLFAAACMATLSFTPSAYAGGEFWLHNGSVVQFFYVGPDAEGLRIVYQRPRQGIAAQGVGPDTLLFEGETTADGHVYGTAYIFKRGCPPTPYHVEGHFTDPPEHTLQLAGYAPVRVADSCLVLGNGVTHNSFLEFNFYWSE